MATPVNDVRNQMYIDHIVKFLKGYTLHENEISYIQNCIDIEKEVSEESDGDNNNFTSIIEDPNDAALNTNIQKNDGGDDASKSGDNNTGNTGEHNSTSEYSKSVGVDKNLEEVQGTSAPSSNYPHRINVEFHWCCKNEKDDDYKYDKYTFKSTNISEPIFSDFKLVKVALKVEPTNDQLTEVFNVVDSCIKLRAKAARKDYFGAVAVELVGAVVAAFTAVTDDEDFKKEKTAVYKQIANMKDDTAKDAAAKKDAAKDAADKEAATKEAAAKDAITAVFTAINASVGDSARADDDNTSVGADNRSICPFVRINVKKGIDSQTSYTFNIHIVFVDIQRIKYDLHIADVLEDTIMCDYDFSKNTPSDDYHYSATVNLENYKLSHHLANPDTSRCQKFYIYHKFIGAVTAFKTKHGITRDNSITYLKYVNNLLVRTASALNANSNISNPYEITCTDGLFMIKKTPTSVSFFTNSKYILFILFDVEVCTTPSGDSNSAKYDSTFKWILFDNTNTQQIYEHTSINKVIPSDMKFDELPTDSSLKLESFQNKTGQEIDLQSLSKIINKYIGQDNDKVKQYGDSSLHDILKLVHTPPSPHGGSTELRHTKRRTKRAKVQTVPIIRTTQRNRQHANLTSTSTHA